MKHILLLLFFLIFVSLQGCTQQGECEGSIVIKNHLPDITIQLEDGEHAIDLSSPLVFKHTANKKITISSQVIEGFQILDSDARQDSTGATILVLKPRDTGNAKVIVSAADDCLYDVTEEFQVTIE